MRIGKVPTNTWRAANLKAYARYNLIAADDHDVADFTPLQRTKILDANAQHYAALLVKPAKVARIKQAPVVSDHSDSVLWRPGDYLDRVAEVDHIIDYQYWGCNHYRNARVLSRRENQPAFHAPRPAANAFEVMCLDTITLELTPNVDTAFAANTVLTLLELRQLLAFAAAEFPNAVSGGKKMPTHTGASVGTTLPNVGAMTSDDFAAIYYNIDQRNRRKRRN